MERSEAYVDAFPVRELCSTLLVGAKPPETWTAASAFFECGAYILLIPVRVVCSALFKGAKRQETWLATAGVVLFKSAMAYRCHIHILYMLLLL